MCWNAETSLASFILGSIINTIVMFYFKDNKDVLTICVIWQFILLIQASEYLIWIDQDCKDTNQIGTKAAMVLTIMQPIFVYIVLMNTTKQAQYLKIISSVIILIYICYMFVKVNETSEYKCTKPSQNCAQLNFKWWQDFGLGGPLYLISLFSILILLTTWNKLNMFVIIYTALSLLFSSIFYSCGTPSMWCFFAVPFPIFLGLVAQYLI